MWVMQHSVNRLTTDLPNISKMIWSTTTSQPPSQDSKNSSKLSIHDTGNEKEKSPTKPELLDLLETNLTTSGKCSSQSKQNNNNSGSTQGKGSTSEQKKSTTPDLSSKLRKDQKLTPQEHQHCLDNKLFLFCGTAGHVTKDCPKSSLASAKAQASDQDKHLLACTQKKTEQSSRLHMTQGLH